MNLYQKINTYLLNQHPNIWITRIHLFAPIGLIVFVGLFLINTFVIGYNPVNNLPDNELPIFLMVIPVLIYMVYWFVFQARYNVEKSGGRLSILQEYVNYFLYFFIFTLALSLILVIPISNDYKVANSVGKTELIKDIEVLNLGNTVVNTNGTLTKNGNLYSFYRTDFVNDYYYYDYYYSEPVDYPTEEDKMVTVQKTELTKIIENYILAFNKYSREKITQSAKQIINENLAGDIEVVNDDYYYDYSYYWEDTPSSKISKIRRFHETGWARDFFNKEMLYVMSAFLAMFALMVWIFKQIHWKYYIFGLIALALTPMIAGLFIVIFYEILRFNEEEFVPILMLIGYISFSIVIILGLNSKEVNHTSVVMAMFLQFYIPFLPLVIWVLYDERLGSDNWELIFWFGWILGLISIGVFKLIYRKMRLLPSKK